jgi:enoyl-CoA hydratase
MMDRMPSGLRVDVRGSVAEVVLNRPGQLNAMEPGFFAELREAFGKLSADRSVRAVLVWAEGRAFSSGLDRKGTRDLLPGLKPGENPVGRNLALHGLIQEFQASISAVRHCPKPVIAAVQGMCLGGGLDLATACDIRLCSADASFAVHETKVAMVADLGTLQRLGRIIGRGIAREMALTGRPMAAERALTCGLVSQILPDRQTLLDSARAMAEEIAQNSPLAVQGVKQVLDYAEEHGEADGLRQVALWNSAFFFSDDLEEAFQAFLDRRNPEYRGR